MQKGDVIYRQAAIDEILKDKIGSNSLKIMGMLGNGNEALTVNMTCDRHIQLLKNLPSAQPEPTLEQIEEYCHKRCLSIVDNALLHKYAQAEIQPEHLTDDDFETIRIHLSAYKEQLGNQHRWKEAEEYQRIIDRFMRFASAQPDLQSTCNQLATDCISRQDAIDTMCSACGYDCDKSKFVYDAPQDEQVILCPEHYALTSLPSAEPSTTWHETFEDDPTTFPNDDRMVLVSFSNCDQPMLGRFWDDAWRVGDEEETFLQDNLFVDGWWELPKKPRREE